MAPILLLLIAAPTPLTSYTEVSHADGITTVDTSVTVPANSSTSLNQTELVTGSAEPCSWRSYVSTLMDESWTSTLVNSNNAPKVFIQPFRSGNAGNTWRLTDSPFTSFSRERTDWYYPTLARDTND